MKRAHLLLPTLAAMSFAIACPTPSAPAVVDAGAAAATAPAEPVAPPQGNGVGEGVGGDAKRIALEETKCGAPANKNGVRICGQSLSTRVAPNGDLVGFAASPDGMTLFGLQKVPVEDGDLVAFGAAGQGAILVQVETSSDGRFDVELNSRHRALALCPGRVLATAEQCKIVNLKAGPVPPTGASIAVLLISNGPTRSWSAVPERALISPRGLAPKK